MSALSRRGLVGALFIAAGMALVPSIAGAQTPSVSINDPDPVVEGDTIQFRVSLSQRSDRRIRVNYATANGSAAAPGDFTAASGRLEFPPGVTVRTIGIRTINDTQAENTETFQVRLSNPDRVTIADGTGQGTILDNDAANRPPVCLITLPTENVITVARNGTVDYAGRVDDPDGDPIVTYQWIFEGGTPGSSNLRDPAPVTYGNTGTFTTTFTATDSRGATCSQVTKQVNVVNQNPVPNVSINSTSQNCGGPGQATCRNQPVTQQPAPGSAGSGLANFKVFAVNDLGMHCGDLDTRVASILPPFNVLRAQVIQHPPAGSRVPAKNPANVTVNYSAASNPNDPFLGTAPTTIPNFNGVFKTNFWDIAQQAYDPFYPGIDTGLNPFASPYNLAMPSDLGLPMPDTELFYLNADGTVKAQPGPLQFNQQAMPAFGDAANVPKGTTGALASNGTAYVTNAPQTFKLLVETQPFFTSFQFGYTAHVNWFTAEGVPIAAFDDFGRENPYPLMRVQARQGTTVVATTDTVVPVSAEADCQVCHAAPIDFGNGTAINALVAANIPLVTSNDDPQVGNVPDAASVEWASDRNILNLHDLKHGTSIANQQPVVCQRCHYTPALDLAQLGPLSGGTGTLGNGREQASNQSMSRVIHNHHGSLPGNLFPVMPAPAQDPNGVITNQAERVRVVQETCYRCHPGDRTQCLRGAMFNGGMLCQDCHGNMTDVGNDFSRKQPNGTFDENALNGLFYFPPANTDVPRIPWANEPGCGSCHTGDFANGSLANTAGTITNRRDVSNNVDNLRLLQAFRSTDPNNKKPIVPTNKRFAEDVITPGATTAPGANPKLYRVSVGGLNLGGTGGKSGHAGVFCEACHGATHAEWPNGNPNANDNVTANQLQGHTGTIVECNVCHGNSLNGTNGLTLDGPHGMHPVGNDENVTGTASDAGLRVDFVDGGHEDLVTGNVGVACHGANATDDGRDQNTGAVLAVAKKDRRLNGRTIPKGTPIGCNICHD